MSELRTLDADAAKELSFGDLVDLLYSLVEHTNAVSLTVQYATKIMETMSWTIDILDDQDIHDAALFIKGFDQSEGYSYLHSVRFRQYDSIPFDGNAKNWKSGGDKKWPTDSQENVAEGS